MMKPINANTKLKSIINDFSEDFLRISEKSRRDYMNSLPAGTKIPEEGHLYTDSAKAEFLERANYHRGKADEILEAYLGYIHESMSEAPSADAVNQLTLLSSRDNITKDEIRLLAEKYGTNYQTYKAIQDVAHKHGIIIADHALVSQENAINHLKYNIDKSLSPLSADGTSKGYYSFLSMAVDNAIED